MLKAEVVKLERNHCCSFGRLSSVGGNGMEAGSGGGGCRREAVVDTGVGVASVTGTVWEAVEVAMVEVGIGKEEGTTD